MIITSQRCASKIIANESGSIKILVGNYEELSSKISNYSEQSLYRIQLEAGKQFSINMADKIEVAAFLPTQNVTLNNAKFHTGEFVEFDRDAGEIKIKNTTQTAVDILLFGGEE
jgi:redox-sensitive bicupin YhaK (pirin superfamily)